MEPFTRLTGRAAALLIANIDTDQIAPARFMKTPAKRGLGRFLFYFLRYAEGGEAKPDFVLNQPDKAGASILITGDNFGCGSSREHAPWALMDFGFRCIIAPSFADIFFSNATLNGLLLIALPHDMVEALATEATQDIGSFTVDIEQQSVTSPSGTVFPFDIEPNRKAKLQLGLDPIGETLQHVRQIAAFERSRPAATPRLRTASA
jgi:3-isopropylmalate dehydratase small subunit